MLAFLITAITLIACSTLPEQDQTNNINKPPLNNGQPVWSSASIGGASLGRTVTEGDQLILHSAGDIADNADAFHFTHIEAEGSVGIVARLAAHEATSGGWPKAGLTIRDSLEPGSPNITIYAIDNSSFRGLVVQTRNRAGAGTNVIGTRGSMSSPLWLRLIRNGDTLSAEVSQNGESWQTVATTTDVRLSGSVFLGPAVASGNSSRTIQATYENPSIITGIGTGPNPSPNPNPNPNPNPDPNPDPDPDPDPNPSPNPNPNPDPMPDPNPGSKTSTTYQIDTTTDFLNPERGFHSEVDLIAGTGFDNVRNRGYTLVRSYVRLDNYRDSAIPASFLNSLRSGLDRLRGAGIKVVLRFSYNFGNAPDASLSRVLGHIDQLEPIFHEYEDVIAVLQAGFIGAWGEWHGSTNNLTSAANKRTIGEALLDAMPDSRMVQVRAPFHRRDIVGAPSSTVEFFGGSNQARLGFKNDCFLSTDSDAGTYGGDQVRDRRETREFTEYTVTGGETCAIGYPSSRQNCVVALDELAQFHWDYLNSGFHSGVLNTWRSQGCFDEISRRLGYRLGLMTGAVSEEVNRGGTLTLDLRMRNDGFGKVYNPRPIDIVLRNAATGAVRTVRAVSDSRAMLPLAGQTRDLQLSITVPGDLPAGEYEVLLSLPDADSRLGADARYSIRLANVGMWQSTQGWNDLRLSTQVR